jgi:hypothetical protein
MLRLQSTDFERIAFNVLYIMNGFSNGDILCSAWRVYYQYVCSSGRMTAVVEII